MDARLRAWRTALDMLNADKDWNILQKQMREEEISGDQQWESQWERQTKIKTNKEIERDKQTE